MESILEWMKGVIILFVILSALMYLIPKAQYKKHIRFFVEMVLVIAVVHPITEIIYDNEKFEESIRYSEFWQEMENLQKDVEKMEFVQGDYHREEYEKAIEEDIRQMAEGAEYEVCQIEAVLSESYELQNIELVIERASPEVWEVAEVDVGQIGEEKSLAEETILKQAAMELRQDIQSFYQLEEEQIVIELKE